MCIRDRCKRRCDVGCRVEGVSGRRGVSVGLWCVVVVEWVDEDAKAGAEYGLPVELRRSKRKSKSRTYVHGSRVVFVTVIRVGVDDSAGGME